MLCYSLTRVIMRFEFATIDQSYHFTIHCKFERINNVMFLVDESHYEIRICIWKRATLLICLGYI
jgi:hypothetical protein